MTTITPTTSTTTGFGWWCAVLPHGVHPKRSPHRLGQKSAPATACAARMRGPLGAAQPVPGRVPQGASACACRARRQAAPQSPGAGQIANGAAPYPNLVYSRAGVAPPHVSVRGTDQDRARSTEPA
ncbi:MAG: hypothetical protein ACOYNY_40330 [Caldilineaceae bacterium]